MELSIIIVSYNCSDLTANCIDSIYEKTSGVDFEVFVVDNASTDGCREKFIADSRVKYICSPQNEGFGRANNLALEQAKGKYVLFLNPDTVLRNDACGILCSFLDSNPGTGACGANLFWPDGTPGPSFKRRRPGIRYELNTLLRDIPFKIRYGKNTEFNHTGKAMEVAYIIGADLMVRREVLDKVGGFNPDFFLYYEETELCHRIAGAGWKIVSVPEAEIMHINGGVTGRRQTPQKKAMMLESRRKYWNLTHSKVGAAVAEAIWNVTVATKKMFCTKGSARWEEWNYNSGIKLGVFSAILSFLNLIMFHKPFLNFVAGNVSEGFNGAFITVSMGLLVFCANYLAFYIVLWLGRCAGRIISAVSFITNSICLYFINTYNVILDDTMMGNVFNTNYAEATSYWSASALAYIIFLGVLPAVLILLPEIKYGSVRRFFANTGISLAMIFAIATCNMPNWNWVSKHDTTLGALLMPWSSIVNSIRYSAQVHERNRVAIPLPDAHLADSTETAVIVIIGESSRRDHFSLYGYPRKTNPLLEKRVGIKTYNAESAATYTTEGVKAIIDHKATNELYEVLPSYLHRTGVYVVWRSSNWGEPPIETDDYLKINKVAERYGITGAEADLDSTLLVGLGECIAASPVPKFAAFIHTSTSHGPTYYLKYPAGYEKFTPASREVEMSRCPVQELINAYDNSILYTDAVIDGAIGIAESLKGWKTTVLFVSDHGESLGENGLYMHGIPRGIAPKEQYEIPFILWTNDPDVSFKERSLVTQYSVFHTVLHLLGIESPVYDSEMDLVK